MEPVVLIVLDGWGHDPEERGNAIAMANTPNLDMLEKNYPSGLLQASGISAGLPWLESGNSEVGHTSMGTGQIFYQALTRINQQISDGSFFTNKSFKAAAQHTRKFSSSLHIMGLLGKSSVHSYMGHLEALIEFAKKEKLKKVFLHLFLDGRDSPPKEGASLIDHVEKWIKPYPEIRIASLIGRAYAMDRAKNWDKTEKTYQMLTEGKGLQTESFSSSVIDYYKKGITDQVMEPIVLGASGGVLPGLIRDNDAVIFFNFREDRARELSYAFVAPERVDGFKPKALKNLFFVTMTEYEKGITAHVAFSLPRATNTLSKVIADKEKKQFKVAETEKYAHITYFFNGGQEKEYKGETRKLVSSLAHKDYAKHPELKAKEIASELISAIEQNEYSFCLANFANADMLGHTGDLSLASKGIEVLDSLVGEVTDKVLALGGAVVITADHGNAERMVNLQTGEALTSHSANPVPYWVVANSLKKQDPRAKNEDISGILPDVAVTVLHLMGIEKPASMDGTSLV